MIDSAEDQAATAYIEAVTMRSPVPVSFGPAVVSESGGVTVEATFRPEGRSLSHEATVWDLEGGGDPVAAGEAAATQTLRWLTGRLAAHDEVSGAGPVADGFGGWSIDGGHHHHEPATPSEPQSPAEDADPEEADEVARAEIRTPKERAADAAFDPAFDEG
ncbi:MAG: hypothetical protein LWW86_10320 [Micrococcales bacterium]|nr:hypothetical protein [Micrococcales bacterium]